jgi:hypothetical protein
VLYFLEQKETDYRRNFVLFDGSEIPMVVYRKFEYFSFGGNHHSNLTNRLRNSTSIGTCQKMKFWKAFILGQNSIKDISESKARYFEESLKRCFTLSCMSFMLLGLIL